MTSAAKLDSLWDAVGELEEIHARRLAAVDLRRYMGNPEGFAADVLRVQLLTTAQCDHLKAAATQPRIAAYGANGCGKTFDDALLALHYVYVENALVIVTSAREGQLRDQFMRDVKVLFQRAPDLDGELHTLALRRPGHPHTGIICVAAGETSRLRGFHAPRVVFMVEEAQGCPDWVFDVAEMVAVGEHDRVLVTGNCDLGAEGPFYRRCQTWTAIRFNSDEHPNVIEGRTVIPGGPTRESRALRIADYGENSPFFLASWLGLFPDSNGDALCERGWIFTANDLYRECGGICPDASEPYILAVDPARYGPDASVLAIRRGDVLETIVTWNKASTMQTAGRVLQEMSERGLRLDHAAMCSGRPTDAAPGKPARLWIDEPGVGGGVIDRLREQGHYIHAFNGGATPRRHDKLRNKRAETYWMVRERLEAGKLALPPDDKLADELCALRWNVGSDGRVELEAKDQLRSRLGRSPDRADALAMTFADAFRPQFWVV